MVMKSIRKFVHINIPFTMLRESYLEDFINFGLNPEIGLDAKVLEGCQYSDFLDIAIKLKKAGLLTTLHSPFIDLAPGSPDRAIREVTRKRFEQVVKVASIFRPKAIVCHIGYDTRRYGFLRKVWLNNSLETWKWLAKELMERDIQLSLENVYEDRPQDILPVFKTLEKYGVKFCFDTGHCVAFGKSPMEDWLTCLGRYLGHLHLHDNDGVEDQHLGLGMGKIGFERLFHWLGKNFGSPPLITLEPHTRDGLWPSLEFLERNWPW